MKKIMMILAFLFLFGLVNAVTTPLSFYSDETCQGNTCTLTFYDEPKYYSNESNELTEINSNFQVSEKREWNYEVNTGHYFIKAKNLGEFQFQYKGDTINAKLQGIGFYNTETKQHTIISDVNFGNPIMQGNQLIWQLPQNSTYIMYYENSKFRDVLTLSPQIKQYLWNHKPEAWTLNNTFVGLIYSFSSNRNTTIEADGENVNDFETTGTVYFKLNGSPIYSLTEGHAFQPDMNHQDENVFGKQIWNKIKKLQENYYLEIVPATAFNTNLNQPLIFNSTINIQVNQSSDDADESNLGIVDTTDTTISLGAVMWGGGIRFQNIQIEQGTEITQAILSLKMSYNCGFICYTHIFGVNEDNPVTWSSGFKPSDRNQTDANLSFNVSGTFMLNHEYASSDLNATQIVQEIINKGDWNSGDALSFVLAVDSIDRTDNLVVFTYDSSYPQPALQITYNADFEPPQTTSDINSEWQNFDANIHLFCEDVNQGFGCNKTYYRMDIDPSKDINYNDTNFTEYDSNVLISTDGNIGIQYYSVDLAENTENTKEEFILIDKTEHVLLTENYLPYPSNSAKSYLKIPDGNLVLTYCYNSGYHLGDAYFISSNNGTNWTTPTQINSDSGYCSGYYSEDKIEPFRNGEGGITLTINSIKDLFFLFTEWNGQKAWTKILYSNQTWGNTTLINGNAGQNPYRDTISITTDSNNTINYIITQKSG
ncbi:hypothetical protein KKG83_06505 [Candidatus Micrarchaeota archaeon]|nr:hypothetical protein [Candidatus Micrarchaeota archaeon]